jgi:putative ABC transport system permease protein
LQYEVSSFRYFLLIIEKSPNSPNSLDRIDADIFTLETRTQMRQWSSLEWLKQDFRYAARSLAANPGFASVALVVLALGIGVNSAIFSIVNTVLLRPLPFRDADRLMMLDEKWLPRFPHFEATPNDFLHWRQQSGAFSEMSAFAGTPFNLTGDDRPERIPGARVSANLTSVLGIEPILGRGFTSEEDEAGNDRVVLLGYRLWQRRFAGDPRVVGKAVMLNDISFTVVGVMPSGFRFPQEAEIWKPMGFTQKDFTNGHFIWAVGRLKPGVTRGQAQAEMDLIMPRLQKPQVWSANVVPLLTHYVGSVQKPLLVLLAAVGFVLLISCANVANLLLARASVRQKEIAVRASLGASRNRIVQQLLTESMLLALIGGALGLLVASGGIVLAKRITLANIPRLDQVALDYSAVFFTLALASATGVLFGLAPALHLSRTELQESLQAGGRTGGTGLRSRLRSSLIITEVALALVLLTGAGLLLKSFQKLLEARPGFNAESVLSATINLPAAKYPEPHHQEQFVNQLLQRVQSLAEVRQAAVSTELPLGGATDVGIRIDGRAGGAVGSGTTANYYAVTPLYLRAMGIPLIRGRFFTDGDTSTSRPVVVINELMARRFFPNEDPIGKRLDISGPTYLREIVGVVGDVKQDGPKAPRTTQVYEPYFQKPSTGFHVVLRGAADPMRLADALRKQVSNVDKDQALSNIRTMDEIVGASVAQDRFSVSLLALFAGLAVMLAAVGIYGVMAYSVTQRTRELGVRMALGARQAGILKLVMGNSLRVVLAGIGIGLATSLALTRVLSSLLYEVKSTDPATFVTVSAVLMGVALIAAFIPAFRASRADPMVALREE